MRNRIRYIVGWQSQSRRTHNVPHLELQSRLTNSFNCESRRFGWRFWLKIVVAVWVLETLTSAKAQPQIEPAAIDENPEQRQIERLILDVKEAESTEPLRAAELFDAAWSLAVGREDPLLHLRTQSLNVLAPGEHRVDAGSRAQLQSLFESSTNAFRNAYRAQVATAAQNAFDGAIRGADAESLREVILRYQFADVGQKALRTLVQLHISRGEYLQAALQFGRLLRLQNDESP